MKTFVWHETDSFLHRLNPLTKLALNVPVVAIVSLTYEPITPLAIGFLALLAARVLGQLPWPALLRPLGVAVLLSVGMFWTSTVFYTGPGAEDSAPAVWLGPIRLTFAGLVYGAAMAARLLAIFATSLLFVLTTDPTEFVLALIQQGRLPYRVGYGVFAAYRFVPLFEEEFANVRAAHQMRGGVGADGLIARLRQVAGYVIPLLAIAVRKGERVALAMDARAFGALPHRTYFRRTALGWNDAIFAVGAGGTLLTLVLVRLALGSG